MTLPQIDMQIHLGDVVLTAMLGLLGIGLRVTVKALREFLKDTRGYRQQSDKTSRMVDRHTIVLRKASLLPAPAGRVYTGKERRHSEDDEELDVLDEASLT